MTVPNATADSVYERPARPSRWGAWLLGGLLAAFAAVWAWQQRRVGEGLIVYTSHDLVFAQPLLEEWSQVSGVPVAIVGDTEASKSLGLVRRLLAEAEAPQADLFWNNELLGTLELAAAGVLAEHRGSGWADRPSALRDADGRWTGLAGRLRVTVSRPDLEVYDLDFPAPNAAPPDGDATIVIADPMFGTTLTHAALLWDRLGRDRFASWFDAARASPRVRFVPGNGPACEQVARGAADAAWTDTDDAFTLRDRYRREGGPPFRIDAWRMPESWRREGEPPRAVVMIPNTAALIAKPEIDPRARDLLEWLLSPEVERRLAASGSRQIPLGRAAAAALADDETGEVEEAWMLSQLAGEAIYLRGLLPARNDVLEFLAARAAGKADPAAPTGDSPVLPMDGAAGDRPARAEPQS